MLGSEVDIKEEMKKLEKQYKKIKSEFKNKQKNI